MADDRSPQEVYDAAVKAVRDSGKASASFIQRTLKIGYAAAARIMDMMEEEGIVSEPNNAGKRTVLDTMTISAPGMDPVTLTDKQLEKAAAKVMKSKSPGKGHNSQADLPGTEGISLSEASREKLRQTVAKIERLEEEKREVAEAIKEIYAEAKAFGFDTKALRAVIRLRKIDKADREEQEMMLETYLIALGEA